MSHCLVCGREYFPNAHNQKYCSATCAMNAKLKRQSKKREPIETNAELHRIVREALAHHMSYGKYIQYISR